MHGSSNRVLIFRKIRCFALDIVSKTKIFVLFDAKI